MKDQPSDLNRRLEAANAATLRCLWASSKGTKPPKTFTARLMRLALAWDDQAVREGRETTRARQAWNRIIKCRNGSGAGNTLVQTKPYLVASGGTRILKDWGGTTHEVLVTEGGATWNGQSYASLSSVARAMTGTNRGRVKVLRVAGGEQVMIRQRCAIYTRKSTEEGLEQSFNSLNAQREACAAYILSQKHEGWAELSERYDDGGFSGGTMDRPGLHQLLEDVRAGRIDVIVVYKVDRLTRALTDFAKMVDVFDGEGYRLCR